jgi:hypothetical protein
VRLREAAEHTIRRWNAHEIARGARQIIDFDTAPPGPDAPPIEPAFSRLDVHDELVALHARAVGEGDQQIASALTAHLAYLRHVLGERPPIAEYIEQTQGVTPTGWPDEYVAAVRDRAAAALADVGIGWGPDTMRELDQLEGFIEITEAKERVQAVADEVEPALRELAGTDAPYDVSIEIVDVDDYWAYWLDGAGQNVRLRFNTRQAVFTDTRLRQFAQHELLGHALQCASYAQRAATEDVPWLRVLSVHLPHQVCLEGLATALPLFVTPHDQKLVTRTRLDHYIHLVRAELHLLINTGSIAAEAAQHARARIPWWTSHEIANELADRGTDPMLRTYLWSYPAGTDWFINLADTADQHTIQQVFRAAYADPLTPVDLNVLWSGRVSG